MQMCVSYFSCFTAVLWVSITSRQQACSEVKTGFETRSDGRNFERMMISQIQTRASRSIVSRSYTLHARLLCCCGDSTVPSRRASLCCVVQTEMGDPTPQEPKQKTSPYLQSSLRTMRLLALASHLLRARLAASGLSLSASHFESLVSHGKKFLDESEDACN